MSVSSIQLEAELQAIADQTSLLAVNDDILNNIFIQNLNAFKNYYPDIFEIIADYHPKRYFINTVDGFPNIYDASSKANVYQYPPYLMALRSIRHYENNARSVSATVKIHEENKANFIHNEYLNRFGHLYESSRDQEFSEKLPSYINHFNLYGIGCGYAIEYLLAKYQIENLYIIEPDLDLFYCSLFTINWQYIFDLVEQKDGQLHLLLGLDSKTYFNETAKIFYRKGRFNAVRVYGYVNNSTPEISDAVDIFRERFSELLQGWGFFDDVIMAVAHLLQNMENKTPLLTSGQELTGLQKECPVIIVGNGPSLDKEIDFIRKHQQHALIISCGTALSALYKYGIKPDLHCEQERTKPVAEKINYYCPAEFLQGITHFAPSSVHPDVFAKFEHNIMLNKGGEPCSELITQDDFLKAHAHSYNYLNPTVANTALTFVTALGFKQCYLVGIDLGHKKDGHHHSKQSLYYNNNKDLDLFSNQDSVEIAGNFGGTFISNNFFNTSRQNLERLLSNHLGLTCFNVSDGVAVKNTISIRSEDVQLSSQLINKAQLKKDLVDNNGFIDDTGDVVKKLIESLEVENTQKVCDALLSSASTEINTKKQAVNLMQRQIEILGCTILAGRDYIYLLLNGTLLYQLGMLMRILLDISDDKKAISAFSKGLHIYQEFLKDAPKFYQEHVCKPNDIESAWIEKLRENHAGATTE